MALRQTDNKGFGSYIVAENDLIGNFIAVHGFWERHLFDIYSQLLTKEDVVLDAGANIGFHTTQFARFASKVYAFEPQPLVFNILTTNVLFHDATDKVKQFRLGLGQEEKKAYMEAIEKYPDGPTGVNLGGRGLTDEQEGEEVEVVIFDKNFPGVDISMIKMDVQGYELAALKGMEAMLTRCKPWMLLENYENEHDQQVINYLTSMNYEVYRPTKYLPPEDCIAITTETKHDNIRTFIHNSPYDYILCNNSL